jgi:hypothetical protein
MPTTRPSSTTITLPILAEAISSTAAETVVVLDTVKTDLLTMAIASSLSGKHTGSSGKKVY